MLAPTLLAPPFHNHSPMPPPSRITSARSVGKAFSNSNISIRFDLPEPFGPIRTFRGVSGSGSLSGANDSTPRGWMVLTNGCMKGRFLRLQHVRETPLHMPEEQSARPEIGRAHV